jgi:RimJ/RimL family protein N-acetyltransferase
VARVVAQAMAVHTASRRVREKSGLTLVRTVHQAWPDRIPGDEHGDVEYALPRADGERQEATGRERMPGHDREATPGMDSPPEDA